MAISRPGIDPDYQRLCEFADSKGYVVELHGERERTGSTSNGDPIYRLALTLLRVSERKRTVRAERIKDDDYPAAARRLVLAFGA